MRKEKLGIFGGTFSPPHKGHFEAAKAFINEIKLDRLLIIPAFLPPHKETGGIVAAEDRIAMCEIAFSSLEKTEISDLEIKRKGKSFTYLTLEELYSEDREIYFLVGTDMFLTLGNWKNPDLIFSKCVICYIRRENEKEKSEEIEKKTELYKSLYNANIKQINAEVIEISSTEMRNRILSNQNPSAYIDGDVYDYIVKKGLYK